MTKLAQPAYAFPTPPVGDTGHFLNEPSQFVFIFSNKHYNFYKQYMWKNVRPVYGAGIQSHDL